MRSRSSSMWWTLALWLTSAATAGELTLGGGLTVTGQSTGAEGVRDEWSASADLVGEWSSGRGALVLYLEGNTSARAGGVSERVAEANADAGTALDSEGKGRVQVSEFYYRRDLADGGFLLAGLVDVTGHFDQSRIASDENTQFLGVSFTANPTIEFPDYTLGAIGQTALPRGLVLRTALTSSHGIADNPAVSYAQLVEVDDDEKGLFGIVSLGRSTERWLWRAGAWVNSSDHVRLDGGAGRNSHRGAYAVVGHLRGRQAWNLRVGAGDEAIAPAARFAGLTYRHQREPWTLGLGAARIFHSDRDPTPGLEDTTHLEVWLRYRVRTDLLVTVDLQRLRASAFGADPTLDDPLSVVGLRLTWLLE